MSRDAKDRAGVLAWVTYETVARALKVGLDGLADNEQAVTQRQEVELWTAAMAAVDGVQERVTYNLRADELLSQLRLTPEAFQLFCADKSEDEDRCADDDWTTAT